MSFSRNKEQNGMEKNYSLEIIFVWMAFSIFYYQDNIQNWMTIRMVYLYHLTSGNFFSIETEQKAYAHTRTFWKDSSLVVNNKIKINRIWMT